MYWYFVINILQVYDGEWKMLRKGKRNLFNRRKITAEVLHPTQIHHAWRPASHVLLVMPHVRPPFPHFPPSVLHISPPVPHISPPFPHMLPSLPHILLHHPHVLHSLPPPLYVPHLPVHCHMPVLHVVVFVPLPHLGVIQIEEKAKGACSTKESLLSKHLYRT